VYCYHINNDIILRMSVPYQEWQRLVDLLAAMKVGGFAKLESAEILEFGRQYRRAAAELSFQRSRQVDSERVIFLNDLVGECYPYIYVSPRRPWPSISKFYLHEFPRAFRQHFIWILLAFIVSMIPAGVGAALTFHDRAVARQVLPAELLDGTEEQNERHRQSTDWMPANTRPSVAAFIITNNIKVCILTFAGGILAGVITLLLLIENGLMLGIVGAGVALDGGVTATNFWAFVAPHGVFELTAIFISGGAGLLLGYALLNPGNVPRRVALVESGKEALKLMLGVASMLVIAGFIESFFSPIEPKYMPSEIKFIVAGIEAVLLSSYFLFLGRKADTKKESRFGELLTPLPPM